MINLFGVLFISLSKMNHQCIQLDYTTFLSRLFRAPSPSPGHTARKYRARKSRLRGNVVSRNFYHNLKISSLI